jgi:hypothetical protein
MRVQIPGIDFVEGVLQFGLFGNQGVEIGVRFGEFGVDLVILGEHIDNRLDGLADDFDDGLRLVQFRLLRQEADGVALAHGNFADVVLSTPAMMRSRVDFCPRRSGRARRFSRRSKSRAKYHAGLVCWGDECARRASWSR